MTGSPSSHLPALCLKKPAFGPPSSRFRFFGCFVLHRFPWSDDQSLCPPGGLPHAPVRVGPRLPTLLGHPHRRLRRRAEILLGGRAGRVRMIRRLIGCNSTELFPHRQQRRHGGSLAPGRDERRRYRGGCGHDPLVRRSQRVCIETLGAPTSLLRRRWPKPGKREGKMGRVALHKKFRGGGTGKLLVMALEEHLRSRRGKGGIASTGRSNLLSIAHSQAYAQGFYERAGYVREGDLFLEDGADHVRMVKEIQLEPEEP
ncbi:SPOSA6832_00238, partial [Sporobolomyces salmonicolor]